MVGFSLPCTISHPANHNYKYFGLIAVAFQRLSPRASPQPLSIAPLWQSFWADLLLLSYICCELCVVFFSRSGFQADPYHVPKGVVAKESKLLPWATQRRCKPFAWTTRDCKDVHLWLKKMHWIGRQGRLKKQIGKEGDRMGSQEKDKGKHGRGRLKQKRQWGRGRMSRKKQGLKWRSGMTVRVGMA